jgi:hypothetical protein
MLEEKAMEVKDYICTELEHISHATARVLDGLSQYETLWRPGPGSNSIALILYHSARFEDMIVHTQVLGQPLLWNTGKWYEKCHLSAEELDHSFTAEQVAAFTVPDFKDIRAYAEAVRAKTLDCVRNLTGEKFDKVLNISYLGDIKLGALFGLVAVHQSEHVGEMSFLRGLQRGMNK